MEEVRLIKISNKQKSDLLLKRGISGIKLSNIKDHICELGILFLTIISALLVIFIFIFILSKAWNIFKINGLGFMTEEGFDQQLAEAFNASGNQPIWTFGALGLLVGTLTTTLGALLISIPMGIGTAIVITELSPPWIRGFLQSIVRLLASIPSIIFGLIGLMVIVPLIISFISADLQIAYIQHFQLDGKSMLAGIIVLSIMILPIIIALSVEAINTVPKKFKEASLALGLSHWRTIVKVILPAAKSGILAGIVLGTGRAIGEAIALSMVSGGVGNIPNVSHGSVFFLTPVLTLASAIVNKSEAMSVPSIESALFACGVVLLITSIILSLFTKVVGLIVKRGEGIE